MLRMRNLVREFEYGLVVALSSGSEAVASFFSKVENNLEEEKNRDEVRMLLALEDHQLSDMGITRDDVRAALMQPLDKSSGRNLSAVRRNRARV